MRRSLGEDDVEAETLEVEDVGHDASVGGGCRGGYEVDEGLVVDMDVEWDAVVEVRGEVHDDVMHGHGFDFGDTETALCLGQKAAVIGDRVEVLTVFVEVGARGSSVRRANTRELVERSTDASSVHETGVDMNNELFGRVGE